MNPTVARLTVRGLLGRRRGVLLLVVPAVLLVISVIARAVSGTPDLLPEPVLGRLGVGTLLPILALVVGTGVIATEIEDGSIVYLLAKPLPRWKIVTTKLAVAVTATSLLAAVPTYVAGLVLVGGRDGIALGYAVAALLSGAAYSALFLLLGVVTRHAVVAGLGYALVWESLVGNFVPGARTLSIQQWGLAVGKSLAADGTITADVALHTAWPLLVLVATAAAALAAVRLGGLTLASEE